MIEELRRFILVAEEGNMTKAAEMLFITQSAMTQSIQRLEREIGVKLLVQRGKHLGLTEEGQSVKMIAEKILDLWGKAKDRSARRFVKPTIAIGMFDNAATRLAGFVQKNSRRDEFDLDVIIDSSGKLLRQLELGVIDVAVIVERGGHLTRDIERVEVFEEELVPIAGKVFKEKIENVPFILYNKGSNTREQVDEVFGEKGIRPRIYAESTSPSFMKELSVLKCGVALLPLNLVKEELGRGALVRQNFIMKWKRRYGIFVRKEVESKYIEELIKEMGGILRDRDETR